MDSSHVEWIAVVFSLLLVTLKTHVLQDVLTVTWVIFGMLLNYCCSCIKLYSQNKKFCGSMSPKMGGFFVEAHFSITRNLLAHLAHSCGIMLCPPCVIVIIAGVVFIVCPSNSFEDTKENTWCNTHRATGTFIVADPGFPIGGRRPRGGGVGGYVLKILYVERKESGPLGGPALGLPSRSANALYYISRNFYHECIHMHCVLWHVVLVDRCQTSAGPHGPILFN